MMEANQLMVAVGVTFVLISVALWALGRKQGKSPQELTWEEQQKRVQAQLSEHERQAKRAAEQQDQAEALGKRFDQLLAKWEGQALRQDAILDLLERQHGLQKQAGEGTELTGK